MSQTHWLKGSHGEWYVVGQFVLIVLVFFGPRSLPGIPVLKPALTWLSSITGGLLFLSGILLLLAAIFRLGSNITAVPYPKEQGTLVETGPYRLVRHPMYCGVILIAFGWTFLVHGWLTLGYAIILLIFFDLKSRLEERWLMEKFPDYSTYQKQVRKLIPLIY